jgi:four helix bundle protein
MTENNAYYKNLKVWQKSIDFVEQIYKITELFPKSETYWLSDQMRRASVSISSNIAEWSGRWSEQEYVRYLHIAKSSALEVETQIIIAERLKYIQNEPSIALQWDVAEIIKMIGGLISHKKSLQKTP